MPQARYVPRTIEPFIRKASDHFPALLVTGARQVGKTTMLRHLAGKNREYVTLDDPAILSLAKRDPALFFKRYLPPLLIDEVQYAPELFPFIKMSVDEHYRPGQFWLSGSQPFPLMKGVSESLAGRVGIVNLLGLSRREALGKAAEVSPFRPTDEGAAPERVGDELPLRELYRIIWRGSYPAPALDPELNRDLYYSSYVQSYIQRDIRSLSQVADETSFFRFLKVAASRTGQLVNLTDMARDVDIAPNTAKKWLSLLVSSSIVTLLLPFHTNLTSRLVKAPKLYFLDTGLCSWLTEWSSPETLEAGAFSGAILETWIFTEILKSWRHHGLQESFFFFRDKNLREIDLLISADGRLYPLEIKKSAAPGKGAVANFALLNKLQIPIGPGGVLCLSKSILPLTDRTFAIPATTI